MFELNYFYVPLSMKEDWRVVSGEIDVILDLVLLLANCVDLSQILNRFFSTLIPSVSWTVDGWFSQLTYFLVVLG